jgi:hypothetical protein
MEEVFVFSMLAASLSGDFSYWRLYKSSRIGPNMNWIMITGRMLAFYDSDGEPPRSNQL